MINNVDEDSLMNSKNELNYFQIPRAVATHGRVAPSPSPSRDEMSRGDVHEAMEAWTISMSLT